MSHNSINKVIQNIFISDVKRIIGNTPFMKDSIHSFLSYCNEESARKKKIEFCFEIKATLSYLELEILHQEISSFILCEMEKLNRNFVEILNTLLDSGEAGFRFYSLGEGPFRRPGRAIWSLPGR